MITPLTKIISKLGLGKIMYSALRPFFHKKVNYNTEIVRQSLELLEGVSPNPNKSCVLSENNLITCQYDLQVIIPAYKTGQYIERCIDSVISQETSYRILVVVINDGSPDNIWEILQKYKNENRIEIISQENRGFSGARNRGLKFIKARYVTFLDSDDELIGSIDHLLQVANKTNADVVEAGYVTFNDMGDLRTYRHDDLVTDKATKLLYGYPWGKIFKAELFAGICFPEGYWFEDTIMAFIIYPLCKRVVTDSSMFYHYRINPQGITAKAKYYSIMIDSYWITERLLMDRVKLGLSNEDFYEVMLGQVRMNYNRIKLLKRKDINLAVFILTVNLWKKYFGVSNAVQSPLATILTDEDYYAYKLFCELR